MFKRKQTGIHKCCLSYEMADNLLNVASSLNNNNNNNNNAFACFKQTATSVQLFHLYNCLQLDGMCLETAG